MSTRSISKKDATSGQPCNEQPHLGSDFGEVNNKLTSAASTSSSVAMSSDSVSKEQGTPLSVTREDNKSPNLIEAQQQGEVSKTAANGTSRTSAPLIAMSTDRETEGQGSSGDSPGHHAAAPPTASSSSNSSSTASPRGTPAPPHEPRSPRPSATPARNEGLRVEIIHAADGLRIENCPPGGHVAIYTPNNVRISLQPPPSTVDHFGQVVSMVFGFKVMQDGGICVLRMPEGTKASGRVVPTVQGREAGARCGGVEVEEIFTAVDGFRVIFRFAL